jgi:radical SAM superfamily enzyme YgiQ (UPF0313 family)
MPMGILYLAATLRRDLPNSTVQIVDLAKRYREAADKGSLSFASFEVFADHVLSGEVSFVPDLIGISVLFSTAHKSTLRVAEVCKRIWPDAPIVVGGMHATNAVEQLLENSAVDMVCRGEGEAVISDLVLDPSGEIPGIVGRHRPDSGQAAPLIYDLDTIPHPAWDLLPMHEYVDTGASRTFNLDKIEQDREATIVTTRGCPFHCTFCSSWTVHGREMRYRSTANVLDELRMLHEHYGISVFIPEDDLFSVKKPRFLALCNAISREFGKKVHFQFPNGLSVATLDAEVIAAMVEMGMSVANIAIESGSNEVQRKIIKKNVNLERARRVVAECRDQGIFVRCYFILGFPGETREQIEETIDFAASLAADWCVFNIAAPLVGTEMYSQLLERGEIDSSFNWDDAFFHERAYDTPEVGAQELKDLGYDGNLRINFFENYNLRCGKPERAAQLFRDIIEKYPEHLAAHWCLGEALKMTGDAKRAEEAFAGAVKLIADESPMAIEMLQKFPQYFPWRSSSRAPVQIEGPRRGMPVSARQAV